MRYEYDLYTAVTFAMIGVGMGALLALILAPHPTQAVGLNRSAS